MICNSSMRALLLAAACAFAAPADAQDASTVRPPWQLASVWPDRIVTSIEGEPATSFSVTWRTDESVGVALAEIAPATPNARFDLDATTHRGMTERVRLDAVTHDGIEYSQIENQGLAPVHYHSITFAELEPDTLYAYRVRGAPGAWSSWRQFRTAPLQGPVQFAFFGDSQTGIRSHVSRIFAAAARVAPDARFALHGGDLVNTAFYDREWAEWHEAAGAYHARVPILPSPGNHDYLNFSDAGDDDADDKLFIAPRAVTPLWRAQFALPLTPSLPADLQETVYTLRYGPDIQVFSIDSSGVEFDAQMAWLTREVAASTARWRIVYMHHPVFSFVGGREHPAHRERRLAFLRVMERGNIDVILTGHRHSYQRGDIGPGVAAFEPGETRPVESVFLITATSTKRGESKAEGWERYESERNGAISLVRYADNVPLFAVFDIDGDALSARVFDATGAIYDSFAVTKDSAGQNSVTDGPEALGPTLTFENSGPYQAWDDLR